MERPIRKMAERYEVKLQNVGNLLLKPNEYEGNVPTLYSGSFQYNGDIYVITIERQIDNGFIGEIVRNGELVAQTFPHSYSVIDRYLEEEWDYYLDELALELQKANMRKPTDSLRPSILNGR